MCTTRNIVGVIALATLAFAAGRSNLVTTTSALAQQPTTKDKPAAQRPAKDKPAAPPEADPKMQAMMKAGMTGEQHKALEPMLGKFEGTVRFKMDAKSDWMESKGTIEREWVLNKHYVRETVRATSDMGDFEGLGYIGYNNTDGQYEFVWLENESTAIMFETGWYDADKKMMTTHGQHRDPATGHVIQGRSTMDISNPDREVYAGYSVGEDGKEFKSFEGVMERVKK